MIGRRFRLAHVRFGRDIVEVATFRATGADADDDERAHSDSGRILRDNVYGTIDEDVWRRDFTVNALYYNITDFSIWDYANGVADVRARTLRLIGDPEKRYREDPVRMLRAVRFAAKLDFTLAPETAAPIASLGNLFKDVPSARLFDELLKLFQSGHAVRSFELLLQYDLLRYLFRDTQAQLETPDRDKIIDFIRRGLANTDQRVREDKPDHADVSVRVVPLVPDPGARAPARERRLERRPSDARSEPAHRRNAADRVPAPLQLADERAPEHAVALRPAERRACGAAAAAQALPRRLRFPRAARELRRSASKQRSTGGPRCRTCRRKSRASC